MATTPIFGAGYKKCVSLQEDVEAALQEMRIEAEVQKIEDSNEIVQLGVTSTPALAIDGKVKIVGKVASP